MKRDLLPVLLLLPVIGFVGYQALQMPSVTAIAQDASIAPAARAARAARHALTESPRADAVAPAGESAELTANPEEPTVTADVGNRDAADVRRRLLQGESGTYIGEILLERDSALARWPDRLAKPIRVWVGSGGGIGGWDDSFPDRVREAFDEWSMLGIPVRFTFVKDSTDADVHVTWIDHFDTPISGKTLWARDRNWWIVNGNITLALHHNGGEALDSRAIHAIALHEVGHLLGLDHTIDTANIMTARVRVRDLSDADRATMRLLYSLPPGSIKG